MKPLFPSPIVQFGCIMILTIGAILGGLVFILQGDVISLLAALVLLGGVFVFGS